MANKLGHQVLQWTPEAKRTVRAAPGHTLKLVGTAALDWSEILPWRQARPDGILMYRPHWDHQPLDDPEGRAREALSHLGGHVGLFDYLEGYNECYQRPGDMARYAAWSVRYAAVLHAAGARYAAGSFSRGNPALDLLPEYYPALVASDALSLHEYGYPDNDGDLLRYRLVLGALPLELRRPVLITEAGAVDDDRRGGWRSYMTAEQMAARLRWYAECLAGDRRVLAVQTFATGTWGDFRSFDLAGVPEFEALLNTQMEEAKEMTLREQFAAEYAAWEAAGGAENNFRKHALAVGLIQPTAEDIKFLAAEARTSAEQVLLALDRVPFR